MRVIALAVFLIIGLWLQPTYAEATPAVIDRVMTVDKVVALSLEGVETPAEMEGIIRILQTQGVKATFFLPGSALKALPVVKAAGLGHEFGNCGMTRAYWGEWNGTAIAKELNDAAKLIESVTGKTPRAIRPPYAYYGENFLQAVASLSPVPAVVRGVDAGDWMLLTPEAVVERVLGEAAGGDIININLKHKPAAAALPEIVAGLKRKGFAFITVNELLSRQPATPERRITFGVFSRSEPAKPYVALTFDDGGPAWRVEAILDTLKAYQVKSTFFLTGEWARANPELVRRMLDEGHEVANHSYSHPRFTRLDWEEARQEISAAETAITTAAGGRPPVKLFRPPYGDYNATVVEEVRESSYAAVVLWDVDTRDWTGADAGTLAWRVKYGVSAGSIVLFHLHGRYTPAALPDILADLTERGYLPTTVSVLLAA